MKFVCFLALCSGVWAQSLQILPSPPSQNRSGSGSFQIMLASPAGKQPVALQWNIRVPDGVTVPAADIVAGTVAESSQKSVKCVENRKDNKGAAGSTYACILAGGQKDIPDGPLAIVKCDFRPGLHSATVRIENVIAVSADSKHVKIEDAEGTVTAR